MINAGSRRPTARRIGGTTARAAAVAAASGATASAAVTQSQNQGITAAPTPQLVATSPGNFAFGSSVPAATSTSAEQPINVKSNTSWGLRLSADSANMRRYN